MGLVHDTVELNDDTVLVHSVTTQCCCVELNDDTVLVHLVMTQCWCLVGGLMEGTMDTFAICYLQMLRNEWLY